MQEGKEVAEGIAAAYRFAYADPHRACTHNKGVMNGTGYIPSFHHVALSLILR